MSLNSKFFSIVYKIVLSGLVLYGLAGAVALIALFLFCFIGNESGVSIYIVYLVLVLPALFIAYKVIKNIIRSKPQTKNNQGAMAVYIKAARLRNIGDEQIKAQLINEGHWSEVEVVEAFKNIS
jgi:hypothetical protein